MSRALRAAARLVGVAAVTVFWYSAWLVGALTVARSPVRRGRWRHRIFLGWGRAMVRVMAVEVEVRGRQPAPPFFLVTNHLSTLDVPVLAARLGAVFVAKAEMAGWPLFGAMCRSVGTVFIDRGRRRDVVRVMPVIEGFLDRGEGVVVFPEGTSTSGEGVEPFYPPLLEVAARRPFPVSYATLSYSTPPGESPAREAVCWWGDLPFAEHMWRVLRVRRIHATLAFGAESVTAGDRKELAVRLQQSVAEQYPGHAVAPPAPRAVAGRAGTR